MVGFSLAFLIYLIGIPMAIDWFEVMEEKLAEEGFGVVPWQKWVMIFTWPLQEVLALVRRREE